MNDTTTNTTFANILIAATTLSSSVMSLSYIDSENFFPQEEHMINFEHSIEDWKDSAFNITPSYIKQLNETELEIDYDIYTGLLIKNKFKVKARVKSISKFNPKSII